MVKSDPLPGFKVPSFGQQDQGSTPEQNDKLVQKKNLTYEQMLELLRFPTHAARDEDALRKIAQDLYAPQYNAETEAARQRQEQTDLSLETQLAALLTNVGAQRDELGRSVQSALSQQQHSALQRGMQRSSYNQASQAGIQAQGVKLNDQISQNLLQQQSGIESQRQQGSQQLAETLARLLVDRTTNENNLMQQLRDQDYERGMTALDMTNQLYQWLAGSYWPSVKDTAGLPEALMPPVEYTESSSSSGDSSSGGYWTTGNVYVPGPGETVAQPETPKNASGSKNKPKDSKPKDDKPSSLYDDLLNKTRQPTIRTGNDFVYG